MNLYPNGKILKRDLKHGAYYKGNCRNADLARWNDTKQKFVYWRHKYGLRFLEEICHPEDDHVYDVFWTECELDVPPFWIPLTEAEDEAQAAQ